MSNTTQRSFAGGEIAPALHARADLARYAIGLRTCRNMVVMRAGGATKRPGTKFVLLLGGYLLTVVPSTLSLLINETATLVATLVDEFGDVVTDQTITWEVDDTGVATIDPTDATVAVTGVGVGGTTRVRAHCEALELVSNDCIVTVADLAILHITEDTDVDIDGDVQAFAIGAGGGSGSQNCGGGGGAVSGYAFSGTGTLSITIGAGTTGDGGDTTVVGPGHTLIGAGGKAGGFGGFGGSNGNGNHGGSAGSAGGMQSGGGGGGADGDGQNALVVPGSGTSGGNGGEGLTLIYESKVIGVFGGGGGGGGSQGSGDHPPAPGIGGTGGGGMGAVDATGSNGTPNTGGGGGGGTGASSGGNGRVVLLWRPADTTVTP